MALEVWDKLPPFFDITIFQMATNLLRKSFLAVNLLAYMQNEGLVRAKTGADSIDFIKIRWDRNKVREVLKQNRKRKLEQIAKRPLLVGSQEEEVQESNEGGSKQKASGLPRSHPKGISPRNSKPEEELLFPEEPVAGDPERYYG